MHSSNLHGELGKLGIHLLLYGEKSICELFCFSFAILCRCWIFVLIGAILL